MVWHAIHPEGRAEQRVIVPALAALVVAGAMLGGAAEAEARGFVGLSFGFPLGPVYAPYPAYSYPPPVAYAPPVVAPATAPPAANRTCREYHSTVMIDGRPQKSYGTACLQPDGTWRIVG